MTGRDGLEALPPLLGLPAPDELVLVVPVDDPVLPAAPDDPVVPAPLPELPLVELPEPELPELGVEELVEASTTIVPFMNGWIAQMYAKVPALVNVCEALWPFFRVPVLKLPSLAVAVWLLGPLLVQVTVSPTWTVIVPGVNLKSEIVSAGSPAASRALTFERTRLLPAALAPGNVSFQDLPVAVRPRCLGAAVRVRA